MRLTISSRSNFHSPFLSLFLLPSLSHSASCLLFQMITGKVPFRGNSEYLTFQKILKCQLRWPGGSGGSEGGSGDSGGSGEAAVDPDLKDLILGLLVAKPSERLGGTLESYAALRAHRFFSAPAGGAHPVDFATIFSQPVPPRPAPCVVVPDPPDVYEYKDDDEDGDGDEDDEGADHHADRNASDEDDDDEDNSEDDEFTAKMAELDLAAAAEDQQQKQQPQLRGGDIDDEEQDEEADDFVAPLPSMPSLPPLDLSPSLPSASPPRSSPSAAFIASRTSTDGQYANSVWSRFLQPGEKILYAGLVIKRRALFARKRQLLLTDAPRLFYVDSAVMKMKKEIQWTAQLWAEVIDATTFYIHTVRRRRAKPA